jgi:hypothetical protein
MEIMNGKKIFVVSVGLGIAATLLTGLADLTPYGLVGARWYGFPATWLRYLVIAPQYNPWKVDAVGLVVDIVLWSAVIGLVLRGVLGPKR